MLRLSELLGRPVESTDGARLGAVRDLVIGLDAPHPPVRSITVAPHHAVAFVVPWTDVAEWQDGRLRLAAGARTIPVDGQAPPLAADELLAVRDVLDTQIIDIDGRRVERVGDVLLETPGRSGLEVAAADVGFGPVCRRLGLRRLAERFGERAIDVADLHLTSERGHVVQLGTTSAAMHRLDAAELAQLVARLSTEHAADVLEVVPPERAAAAVAASHPEVRRRVLRSMRPRRARLVLEALPAELATRARRHLGEPRATGRRLRRHRGWRRRLPPGGPEPGRVA